MSSQGDPKKQDLESSEVAELAKLNQRLPVSDVDVPDVACVAVTWTQTSSLTG